MTAAQQRLPNNPRVFATVLGSTAILFWAAMPVLRLAAGGFPPFQLAGLALAVAASLSWAAQGGPARVAALGPGDWLLGSGALLGAQVFYFHGLTQGAAAAVSLLAYLWPLLFVVLSYAAARRAPSAGVWAGTLLGLAGSGLVILGDSGLAGLAEAPWRAYGAGLGSGICWALYSHQLQRRRYSMGAFTRLFALAALAAVGAHAIWEPTVLPQQASAWGAALAIGAGPYGLAFLAWGFGVSRGNADLLSALSYAVPILAALALVAAGYQELDARLPVAALAVAGGAWLASRGRTATHSRAPCHKQANVHINK